jgi:Protein of unknown function (DUF1566)
LLAADNISRRINLFLGDDFMTHSIKTKLATAMLLTFPCFSAVAAVEGTLETANCDVIKGWAWDNASPATRVKLDIYDVKSTKAIKLVSVTANLLRNDLTIGDKKYGFSYILPASVRNAVKHKLSVRINGTTSELTNSPKITATACYGELNDTGIQACSDFGTNGLTCPVAGFAGQDAEYGRDAVAKKGTFPKIGKGSGGFDFTKIANDGSVLPTSAVLGTGAKYWACTRDNVTGLIWEVKTADGGLRDLNNTYSWYNPDNKTNGGFAGYPNDGSCTGGISCNTESYKTAVNTIKLCGRNDWRVPKKSELYSIIDYSRYRPTIDTTYFPNTPIDFFWSSSPYAGINDNAWSVSFYTGTDYYDHKYYIRAIRLVRGGQ